MQIFKCTVGWRPRAGLESRLTLTQDLTLTAALFFLVEKCFSPLTIGVVWDNYSYKLQDE